MKPNPESSQTDYDSSSYGEYTVPEVSDNVDDNDSYKEDQDGDTYYLEIGANFKNPFFYKLLKEIISQILV